MPVYVRLLLLKEKSRVERRLARKSRAFIREDFESIFQKKQNPWGYHTPHQQHRINLLYKEIPHGVTSILEVGSAEGTCTSLLAQKAARVVAMDISRTALQRARINCRTSENIDFVQGDVLRFPFQMPFDVILCAGVLVYFPEETLLKQAIHGLLKLIAPAGLLIVENMWGRSGGSRTGSSIHEIISNQAGIQLIKLERQDEYGISVFQKRI